MVASIGIVARNDPGQGQGAPGRKSIERDEQETVRRPGADPRDLCQRGDDLVVRHPEQRLAAQAPVDEPFRDRAYRRPLPERAAALPKQGGIRSEQFGRRRQSVAEALLESR
jgi:hypothetical protein